MPRFNVKYTVDATVTIEVDASDADAALEKAQRIYDEAVADVDPQVDNFDEGISVDIDYGQYSVVGADPLGGEDLDTATEDVGRYMTGPAVEAVNVLDPRMSKALYDDGFASDLDPDFPMVLLYLPNQNYYYLVTQHGVDDFAVWLTDDIDDSMAGSSTRGTAQDIIDELSYDHEQGFLTKEEYDYMVDFINKADM